MNVFIDHIIDFLKILGNKIILFCSFIFGILLSAIGYPKEILVFILALIIIDLLTKHYSITVINYRKFNLQNYIRAWQEKNLTSRAMKIGVGMKSILYLPLFYIAHQTSIIPEIIYGQTISSVLYSLLVIIESISVIENLVDCGHTKLIPFLSFFKKKEEEIIGTQIQDINNLNLESKGEGDSDLQSTI